MTTTENTTKLRVPAVESAFRQAAGELGTDFVLKGHKHVARASLVGGAISSAAKRGYGDFEMLVPGKNFGPRAVFPLAIVARAAEILGVGSDRLTSSVWAAASKRGPNGGDTFYKSLAVTEDGRYVSIFDGQTEYRLGETLHETARTDHDGGYYCYGSIGAARKAALPKSSAAKDLPRVIVRVRVSGNCVRYVCKCNHCEEIRIASNDPWYSPNVPSGFDPHSDKFAFSYLTPLEVVEVIQPKQVAA